MKRRQQKNIYVKELIKTISYSKNNKLRWWLVVVITG